MARRYRRQVAVVAAALTVGAVAAAPAGGRAGRCRGRTEQVHGPLRIVTSPYRDTDDVFFCYRDGRRHRIFHTNGESYEPAVRHVTVAGAFVAYELSYLSDASAGASREHYLDVRRVASGQLESATPLHLTTEAGRDLADWGQVKRLVLKDDGAVAWSDRVVTFERRVLADRIVKRDAAASTEEVLEQELADDRGTTAIDLRSLRLRGSTLTWRHAGVVRSARLR